MLRLIMLSIFILFVSGCGIRTAPITEYKINTKIQKLDLKKSKMTDKSIKVSQAFSSNSLMSLDMNYMQGNSKEYSFTQSQWSQSPNKALTLQMVKLLRNMDLFKSVQVSKSRSKSDWILEIYVEDFMQYFDKNLTSSYVNIEMTLTLIDTKDNSIVASKTFYSKLKSRTLNAEGGAEALNMALENILLNSAKWFEGIGK